MSNEGPGAFGIGELAMRVGVTPRTVRYYVAEGLLPPPGGGGQNRTYTEEHLLRLQAIKRLKEAYLPLGEIRRQMEGLSRDQLEELVETPSPPQPSSALDYIGSVLSPSLSHNAAPAPPSPPSVEMAEAEAPAGSVWRRVSIAPGVELHYEPSGDNQRDAAIARLVEEARKLLSVPQQPTGQLRS